MSELLPTNMEISDEESDFMDLSSNFGDDYRNNYRYRRNLKIDVTNINNTTIINYDKNYISTTNDFIINDSYHEAPRSIDIREDVELLEMLKYKCNGVEKEIKEMMQEEKDNECPICIEEIRGKSYFTGLCGHKFCSRCICDNMSKNKHSGHLCPLCRKDFM